MHVNKKFNEIWHQHHFGAQTNGGLIIITSDYPIY